VTLVLIAQILCEHFMDSLKSVMNILVNFEWEMVEICINGKLQVLLTDYMHAFCDFQCSKMNKEK
jgi:hypothetical protein